MQWAIGDWYNAIPKEYEDKKAACEKAGLNYGSAKEYGYIAGAYEKSMRIDGLTFYHHQKIASLPLSERTSLLRRAQWGELKKDGTTRRPWTTAELVQERDTILGREKTPLPDFDAKVDKAVMAERHSADKKPDRE